MPDGTKHALLISMLWYLHLEELKSTLQEQCTKNHRHNPMINEM